MLTQKEIEEIENLVEPLQIYIIEKMKELGILLSIDGPLHNVIKIKPPLVFSEGNAEFLIDKLDEVLQDKVLIGL